MEKILLSVIYLAINSSILFSQVGLTIEGTVVNNTESGFWDGVNIQRNQSTEFVYRNNSITSVNTSGYILQAGDEGVGSTNNNLEGEIITGNKITWNGTDMTSITHGVFTGYNLNAVLKYNYLTKVPMGLLRKSNGMTNSSGGIAYNICNRGMIAVVVKGMNGVNIYNNTFYSDRTFSETNSGRPLVDIYANDSFNPPVPSTGTKIKNNIFYTKYQVFNIKIEAVCLTGFECDYNVYFCEAGTPVFDYCGETKTFSQWQALGYDTHSVVINPNFIDFVEFIPRTRLNYGVNLGTEWQAGLSTTASWIPGTSPSTTNQSGTWQVGARIYDATTDFPVYVMSIIKNFTPEVIEISYNLNLANIVPSVSSFSVIVNSINRTVISVSIVEGKAHLTLSSPVVYGDIVTVSYTKPSNNILQSVNGGQVPGFQTILVTNEVGLVNYEQDLIVVIYPNPAKEELNILFNETVPNNLIIRISKLSGQIVSEYKFNAGGTVINIPLDLEAGIFIVEGLATLKTIFAKQIVVSK